MSAPVKARTGLPYIDPATFTPHFIWKKSPRSAEREVYCEGVPLKRLAEEYGTPLYVYSRQAILDSVRHIQSGLGGLPHRLCFAVKANGNLSILDLLARNHCGFDIVSAGELNHLGRIAVPGQRIVFSGVGKTREEIRDALRYKAKKQDSQGIFQFNVESAAELDILLDESSRLKTHNTVPGVSIRVNPDVAAGGHPHISTGLQHHKFGLSWPEARALYLAHRNSKQIRWQGISAHIGSQIVSLAPFREALKRLATYLLDLRKQGIALTVLDCGGGLAVRYTQEKPASHREYAALVAKIVRPLGVKLLLEPGRSIIGPAGVLLSRVIYSKRNSKKSFVIIDAAMNDLMRPVLYDAPHPVTRISGAPDDSKRRTRVDVVGPVCETGDSFLQDWPMGEPNAGEIVAIWAAGAYGMSQTSNYNGRCRPAEVLVEGKRSRLIRRRETHDDVLATDMLAPKSK